MDLSCFVEFCATHVCDIAQVLSAIGMFAAVIVSLAQLRLARRHRKEE
ncbi:MAG: hypothetical protein Q4E12_07180 [Coriobacteriia bacterium]|nr:hypothetical protein [Coriobacteriia bacterium]